MFIMENQFRRISANKGGGGGGAPPPPPYISYIHHCNFGPRTWRFTSIFAVLETLTIRVSKLSLTDSGPKFVNTENKLEEKKNIQCQLNSYEVVSRKLRQRLIL
ncbi:hypothetical protein Peur_007329 [Populus x canadensis]